MKLRFPPILSCQIAARGFKKLQHVCLEFNYAKEITSVEHLIRMIEVFVENGNVPRKISLEFLEYKDEEKAMIKELQTHPKFLEWCKIIKFNFIPLWIFNFFNF